MDKRFKKIFSVLFATLVGTGIVLLALKGSSISSTNTSSSYGDGNSVWKDALTVIPQASPLKTTSVSREEWGKGTATTTVDIVSRELLFGYALAQSKMSTTTMSDAEALAVAQTVVEKIELPQAKQYSEKNLTIVSDNSPESLASYSKAIVALTGAFTTAQTRTDLDAVFTTPEVGGDTKRLAGISENIALYDKLIKGLLAVKTPSLIAPLHLRLLQKYANIQAKVRPMAEIFTDPLKGLRALSEYQNDVNDIILIAKELQTLLSKNR